MGPETLYIGPRGRNLTYVLKTLVLEMVVLMYRTAVDKGADPRELLGVNSSFLKNFHEIHDDIRLSQWLTRWLEAFISISIEYPHISPPVSISLALEYIKNNLDKALNRDKVARICNNNIWLQSSLWYPKLFIPGDEL